MKEWYKMEIVSEYSQISHYQTHRILFLTVNSYLMSMQREIQTSMHKKYFGSS